MLTPEEKEQISNDAHRTFEHEIVQRTIEELADNLGLDLEFPLSYGLAKVVNAAAQVAIAYERGIDPKDLLLTRQEAYDQIVEQSDMVLREGGVVVPVILE